MSENTVRCIPGWGFYPTSYELARFYLYPKVHSLPVPQGVITDVELYKYHPAELAEVQKEKHEKACYFFTPRERKYKNGSRPNRAVKENQEGQGYWKATGRDEEIKDPRTKEVIALKKTLVYYHGKPGKDVKTDWIMQEYTAPSRTEQSGSAEMTIKAEPRERAEASDMRLDDWVLCKIYLNSKGTKKRKKKAQVSNDDARKQPCIDEDAWYEHYNIDEEINKFMEDGEEECIIEDQAILPDPVVTSTLATQSNNHRQLLMQHGGPARYTQQSAGLLAMQATGPLINQLQPMQAARPASYEVQQMQVVEHMIDCCHYISVAHP